MSDAKKIVESLFEGTKLEMNATNVHYLFDNDYELDYKFDNYITRSQGKKPEYEEAYKAQQKEWRDTHDNLNSKYEHIEAETGGEGECEYCYGVIKIGDTYIKAEWSYYSYNGCECYYIIDTLKIVTPKTKTITVYE